MSFLSSGAADKGWNDPPKSFSADGGAATANEKRSALTRRVFHDLNAARAVGSPAAHVPHLPPLSALSHANAVPALQPLPPPVPLALSRQEADDIQTSTSAGAVVNIDRSGARPSETNKGLEFCRRVFSLRVATLSSSAIAESEHLQRIETIDSAIATMSEHWLGEILSSAVKEMLVNVAQAIECRDFESAKCKLQSLIAGNGDQVPGWLDGIRLLLGESQ